jgi:hypothetical protein
MFLVTILDVSCLEMHTGEVFRKEFLTAACCPKRYFYTHTPPHPHPLKNCTRLLYCILKIARHLYCIIKKAGKKKSGKRQKKAAKRRENVAKRQQKRWEKVEKRQK